MNVWNPKGKEIYVTGNEGRVEREREEEKHENGKKKNLVRIQSSIAK